MRVAPVVVVTVGFGVAIAGGAGCTDDPAAPLAPCEPVTSPPPSSGPYADPLAIELPFECTTGGLRHLPGRWFLRDPVEGFSFQYPRFEGSCETGFRRTSYAPDEQVHGSSFHTWSDGTRFYTRWYIPYKIQNQLYEVVQTLVACMTGEDTLAARFITLDADRRETVYTMAGARFAPRDGEAAGLELVGELRGRPDGTPIVGYNVAIDGGHAYLVGPNGFDVVDVSDPAAPVHRASVQGGYNDVQIVHGAGGGPTVAFLSALNAEFTYIVDITSPPAPVPRTPIFEFSHSVQTQTRGGTTLLYLATYTDQIPVYDVTSPLTPIRVGAAPIGGPTAGVHDLTVDGDRLYANYTTQGLVALDTSAGLGAAVELGRIATDYSHASAAGTAGGRPVVLHGDEGMTPDGGAFLRVLDADRTSPTFLRELGRYQSRPEVGIHNIVLRDDRAYIAYYQDGVRVVSLADPANPVEVAHYNTWNADTAPGAAFEGAVGIKLVGDLLYIADAQRGLLILRVL